MAEPVVRLDADRVSVEPGGQVSVVVRVSNAGNRVEGYRLEVLGDGPRTWAEVVPDEVSVYPGQEATATVVLSPPAGAASRGGSMPFGVLVRSTLDPSASASVEGDVEVGTVLGVQAKIVPVTSSGRWRGRHSIRLSNWGNGPTRLRLQASDPDDLLGFYLRPDEIELPIGSSTVVRLKVRARRPFLRGTPVRRPFQVTTSPPGASPPGGSAGPSRDPGLPSVDGALEQRPILSRFVVPVALLLIAGVVAAGFFLLGQRQTTDEALQERGLAGPPDGFSATTSPTGIRLAWAGVRAIEGYDLEELDPATGKVTGQAQRLGADQEQLDIIDLVLGSKHCYRIASVRQLRGAWSAERCGVAGGPSPTPSPSPSVSPSDGQGGGGATNPGGGSDSPSSSKSASPSDDPLVQGWVAALTWGPDDEPGVAAVEAVGKSYQDKSGTPVSFLRTSERPQFVFSSGNTLPNSYVAYVGPFADQAAADAACAEVKTTEPDAALCASARPGPFG